MGQKEVKQWAWARRAVVEAVGIFLVAGMATVAFLPWSLPRAHAAANTGRDLELSLSAALAWGEQPLWIDARSSEEFESGHVPKAVLLNEDHWDDLLGDVIQACQPPRPVIVYCSNLGCQASKGVAARLKRELGWEQVYVLKGGWEAWLEAHR